MCDSFRDCDCRVLAAVKLLTAAFVKYRLYGRRVLCLQRATKPRPRHRRRPVGISGGGELRLLPTEREVPGVDVLERVHTIVGDPTGWR